ncbi:hypothetical protein [Veronia pacifica]|uniref:Uncharacterized protein n=1 Tax=Veronia pacifica TaxID=1080227 RepID=A0A1C3EM86_9GAMM|nr:hypothetical protein [Veronia pacifica]ODA34346.1 hypothetical protein A8L45_06370 [Veronia pacifica]
MTKLVLLLVALVATAVSSDPVSNNVIEEYKKLAELQSRSATLLNNVVAVNIGSAQQCDKVANFQLLIESKQFDNLNTHVHQNGQNNASNYIDKLTGVVTAVCDNTLTSIVQAWFKETITRYRISAIENPEDKALRQTYYCLVKSLREYDRSKEEPNLTVENLEKSCGVKS